MPNYTSKNKGRHYTKMSDGKFVKLFNKPTWILVGAYPQDNIKAKGSIFLQKYDQSDFLEYYLDFINFVSVDPHIIIISGVSHREFVKHHRSDEYALIENKMFEHSNSAEDLKLGILGTSRRDVLFIEKPSIPSLELFKRVAVDKSSKLIYRYSEDMDSMGAVKSDKSIKYLFKSPNKLIGTYFIGRNELENLKKKFYLPIFSRNKFAFEIMADIKFNFVEDIRDSND
jgi:hypothetical protein